MKQKADQVQTKKQTNGVQKKKAVAKTVAIQKAAPEISAKVPMIAKKQQKPQKKVLPPKKVVEEEEDDEEEVEEGSDSGADVQELIQESEAEEDDEEDEEEEIDDENTGEDDDNDDEDDEQEEDSDETPDEEPIKRETKKVAKADIADINSGILPKGFPYEQVVKVMNLPQKFKQEEIVEAFSKYGTIHTINTIYGNNYHLLIAFTTEEAAKAALAADKAVTINGSTVSVSSRKANKIVPESRERSVYVKNVKLGTTNDQLKEIFKVYGNVEKAVVFTHGLNTNAIVIFEKEEDAVESAKHLHNSVLNESTICVYHGTDEVPITKKDEDHTVVLKNLDKLEYIAGEKLEKIFSTCGEIESLDILCSAKVLAFITFKSDKSVKKALKLSGTTVDGIQIDLRSYEPIRRTTIYVKNIKRGAKEDDLRALFEKIGPIESITLKETNAIIEFEKSESYCKSFLLHGTKFQGRNIYICPYSEEKNSVFSNTQNVGINRLSNKQYGNKWAGNNGPGNKWPGNKGPGNKWPGNKGPGNKWAGNNGLVNKWAGNKGPANKWPGNKGPGNKGPGFKRPAGKPFDHHQNKKQKMI